MLLGRRASTADPQRRSSERLTPRIHADTASQPIQTNTSDELPKKKWGVTDWTTGRHTKPTMGAGASINLWCSNVHLSPRRCRPRRGRTRTGATSPARASRKQEHRRRASTAARERNIQPDTTSSTSANGADCEGRERWNLTHTQTCIPSGVVEQGSIERCGRRREPG